MTTSSPDVPRLDSPSEPSTPGVRHVTLGDDTLRRLQDALDAAFDVDGVARLLRVTWNRKLENIVPPGSTGEQVLRGVVLWALQARDVGLHGLLAAACAENPTNPELNKLAAEWDGVVFDPPPLPYPGMHPFTEEERARFFGRASETTQALDLLRRHPFLAIIGPSGSGKSSLLAAGIVPALQEAPAFAGAVWQVVAPVRPGAAPLAKLADALGVDAAALSDGHDLPPLPEGTRRLLVVDQFEELFTTAPADQRGPFMAALQRVMAQPCTLTLLAARADFYADLMASPLWPAIRDHRLEIVPPRGDALRAAIAQPAEDVGVTLDAALVERLLADAGDEPGVLPFVQETLVMLWGRMAGLRIGLAEYEDLVGDRSGRSGLEVALARHADGVYTSALADETQRAIARRTFLRLIQFGEGRSDTRRQRPVDALRAAGDDAAAFDATLAALAANRLVTLGDGRAGGHAGARTVDLAHEALIHGWPMLGEWIARWRAAEQTRQQLEEKAAERERLRAQGEGGLLDAVELAEAEDWLAGPAAAELGKSEALRALVADSHHALDAAARRRAGFMLALVVGFVLALIAASVAVWQRGVAREQREVAVTAQADAVARADEAATAQAVAVTEANARATEVVIRSTAEALAKKEAAAAVEARATAEAERAVAEAERQRAEEQAGRARAELLASKAQQLINDGITGDRPLLLARDAVLATWTSSGGFVTVSADAALRRAVDRAAWSMTLPPAQARHVGAVNTVRFSPDGATVMSAGDDGTLRLWDAVMLVPRRIISGHTAGVNSAAYNHEGTRIVSAGADSTIRMWDAMTGLPIGAPLEGHTGGVSSAAYSLDGAHIVSAGSDGTVRVWNAATGKQVGEPFEGHASRVNYAAYSPNGTYIVSAGEDGTVRVWNTATGEQIGAPIEGHPIGVNTAEYSPDGKHIVSAGMDGTVLIWDAATRKPVGTLLKGNASVDSAAYSPDGTRIISVLNGVVQIWNVATWELAGAPLHTSAAGVRSAAYSPDGRRIVGVESDGTLQVWDATTGEQVGETLKELRIGSTRRRSARIAGASLLLGMTAKCECGMLSPASRSPRLSRGI